MNSRWPGQATPNSLRDFTKTTILNSGNKTYPSDNTSTTWPTCLMCRSALPRKIKSTGMHHSSCPWNYYIECENCGYQNNLSKLLGFWHGCSTECREQNNMETKIDKGFSRALPNETKHTHTYLPTYVPNKTATNETGGKGRASL